MKIISSIFTTIRNMMMRHRMRQAAFLLREDYNNPSMQEFNALDANPFLDDN